MLVLVSADSSRAGPEYDILLKGGHAIDPANGINTIMDIGVASGKIARGDASIPP
jgi:dihydroorotase